MEQTLVNLDKIGFYTLSNKRALQSSVYSPLWRAELLLTPRCNFKCLYCRRLLFPELSREEAISIVDLWASDGLKNIRFSGGEPTLWRWLDELVDHSRNVGIGRIAISTNGSADYAFYERLTRLGVNDWSISLDAGCCSIGDKMSGGVIGAWDKVVANIRELSKLTYVTVGMVFTEENVADCLNAVLFADNLGVSDIRVIPSAQYNKALKLLPALDNDVLNRHPILKYRVNNIRAGVSVRGINEKVECRLVLDDMAVAGGYHYPCIVWLREGGKPIGNVSVTMRQERLEWMKNNNTLESPICAGNCLDVCVAFNKLAGNTL